MPGQLRFTSVTLAAADRQVPAGISTPVQRWRRMVVLFEAPHDARCSTKCMRHVGVALADYANREGSSCFPSVARLAADTGYSERQVQYALAALERLGLIGRDRRGGRGRTTRYELACAVDKRVENLSTNGRQLALDPQRVREATPKGCDPSHPRSVIEDRQYPRPGLIRPAALGVPA